MNDSNFAEFAVYNCESEECEENCDRKESFKACPVLLLRYCPESDLCTKDKQHNDCHRLVFEAALASLFGD